jgi:hypothetical protein
LRFPGEPPPPRHPGENYMPTHRRCTDRLLTSLVALAVPCPANAQILKKINGLEDSGSDDE